FSKEAGLVKSVNKVILIGNLGKDPEVKFTPQGTPVAKITLATNERFKGKDGQWQDRTEWHNVVLWQRLAEIAGEYLKKGGKVYIEGRLQTRSWDDKQSGQKKYMTEIVANDLVLLGGRGESGGGEYAGSSRGSSSSSSTSSGGNNFDQSAPEPEHVPAGSSPITDEDMPFKGNKLAEIRQQLAEPEQWKVVNEHHIVRTYKFPDFKSALAFVNRVGAL